MSTRERPLDLVSPGAPRLRLGELGRMADAVERITGVQGANVDSGSTGLIFRDVQDDWFWAKVTAKDGSSPKKYSWTLVHPDGTGGWLEPPGGPSGTPTSLPAYEMNGADIDVTSPVYVKMYKRPTSMVFDAAAFGDESAFALEVSTWNGTTASSVEDETIQIQFDTVTGVTVTNPSSGIGRVALIAASTAQMGAVTTGAQSFAGIKSFIEEVRLPDTYGGASDETGFLVNMPDYNADNIPEVHVIYKTTPQSNAEVGDNWARMTLTRDTLVNISQAGEAKFVVRAYNGDLTSWRFRPGTFSAFTPSGVVPTFVSYDGTTTYTGATGTDSLGNVFRGGWCTTVGSGSVGTGTVTSIDVSGGTTGLTTSGGPITTSGTITLSGTLNIANGGTGQTTASSAINALLPSQSGNSGKFLTTNGSAASWGTPSGGSAIDNESGHASLVGTSSLSSANGTWSGSIISVSLSEAGTYELWFDVRGKVEMSAGSDAYISARMDDGTFVVADSETLVVHTGHLDVAQQATGSCRVTYTASGAVTIALQVKRDGASTWTTSDLLSDANGRTKMGWTRIA